MKTTMEARLGMFFALALIAAVVILELAGTADFLKPSYPVVCTFPTVQELKEGDPVKMAGVEIGRVQKIELVGQNARVTMRVLRKYAVKTDSKAIIKFTGLMGQHFISIEGGMMDSPNIDTAGGTLQTSVQPDLSTLMAKLEGVATGVEGLTKSFSSENLSSMLGPVNDFIRANTTNLTAILSNAAAISYQVTSGQGTVGKLLYDDVLHREGVATVGMLQLAAKDGRTLINQAQGTITEINKVIAGINAGEGTIGKLARDEKLYQETTVAMTNLREALEKVNKGQGSVGRLLNDDSLFRNAKLTLQKLDKATEGLEDQGPLSIMGIAVNSLF